MALSVVAMAAVTMFSYTNSAIQQDGYKQLVEGPQVEYEIEQTPKSK